MVDRTCDDDDFAFGSRAIGLAGHLDDRWEAAW